MKSRSKDLCPYDGSQYKDENLVSSFVELAKKEQKQKGVYDFLIIPGDITNNSNLIDRANAFNFFSKQFEIKKS